MRTGEVGGEDGHLRGPAEQLLNHALRRTRGRQHRAALSLRHINTARARPRPECLRVLQQLRATAPALFRKHFREHDRTMA